MGGRGGGFALVVTISLMVLLMVVGLGILSLAAIQMRASGAGEARLRARANARLGLLMALNDLQESLGPDTRISANGEILAEGHSVAKSMRQIAGAWEAWRPDPRSVGDYDERKAGAPRYERVGRDGLPTPGGGFHRWLVSSVDREVVTRREFVETGSSGKTVPVVGGSPALSESGRVVAELVSMVDGGKPTGRFAWGVFDEGQKASTGAARGGSDYTALERLATQEGPAWRHVDDWKALADLGAEDQARLVSLQTTALGGVDEPGESFHDLTTWSSGVLADVSRGGLRTDLSLLFSKELPKDYRSRHIYSGSDTPLLPPPDRGRHPYKFPSPDPKWVLLRDFCRLPIDEFSSPESARLKFAPSKNPQASTIPARPNGFGGDDSYHDDLKLAPVISKAQFFFSATFARGGILNNVWNNDGGRDQSKFKASVLMVIDPVITLWNPYDAPMDVSGFRIFLYRLPIAFRFTTGNRRFRFPTSFTEYVQAIAPGANDRALAYSLAIKPQPGESAIELLPGEHRVFSAQDYQTSASVGNGRDPEVVMRLGWYPPGVTGSDASKIGGISTQNLCRDLEGGATARFQKKDGNWMSIAGLALEANDWMEIEVRPSVEELGEFQSVGGEAVDFFLRYVMPGRGDFGRGGEHPDIPDFGSIELDYGEGITSILEEYRSGRELPRFPIGGRSDILNAPTDAHQTRRLPSGQVRGTVMKKPFLVATLHLKSLTPDAHRSKFPAKAWIHNNPTAIYASAGAGNQLEDLSAHQYEFSWQPLQGSWDNEFPELVGGRDQGFGGPSPGVTHGKIFAPFASLPREEVSSLAQLRHAPLNQSGKLPLQVQVVGNSFAHPLLAAGQVMDAGRSYLDHSYLANRALFDGTFFSSARNASELGQFLDGGPRLVNGRFRPYHGAGGKAGTESLLHDTDNHRKVAAHLMLEGAFNVNSTSVRAWQAFLTAMNGEAIPFIERLDRSRIGAFDNSSREAHVSRYHVPIEDSLGDMLDPFGGGMDRPAWKGHRRLDEEEIRRLAVGIVEEVKLRGPFQSLGEFINRRAEDSDLGVMGCLQAAIEKAGLNHDASKDVGIELTGTGDGSSSFQCPEAAEGSSNTGTPSYITQGDLLHTLAPYLAVRSDTFRIRSYGEATDGKGRVIARAWCEAVVQRTPEYVDHAANSPSDHDGPDSAKELSESNSRFGRRFRFVSFRWLPPQDSAAS